MLQNVNSMDILIVGTVNRNRAIHGDVVVVEVLPEAQWKSRNSSLQTELRQEPTAEGHQRAIKQPTGHVVGVLLRNWRPFVATLQQGEAEKHGNKVRASRVSGGLS